MLDTVRRHPRQVVVALVYYAGLVGLGVATGGNQTVFYAALMPVLFVLVAWLDSRVAFSELVLWGLTLWGWLHMMGGLVPATDDRVLYNVWLLPIVRFDHLVHAVGFGFAGLAFWEQIRPTVDTSRTSGAAIALFGGVGIGGLNEMIEFLISQVVEDTNIGGFENTGWDLVANLVGASLIAAWLRRRWRHGDRTTTKT